MDIRQAVEADRAEWLRLRRLLWPGLDAGTHEREMRDYAARGAEAAVFVADRGDGRLGGFIEVSTRDRIDVSFSDPVAYVEGWYVDAGSRRAGLGRRLMRAAEAWARGRGLRQIGSDTDVDNDHSIRAHAALGFRETIRLVHFLKDLGRDDPAGGH
jgi:aminoglycoside 6'-N-acetyltransferase I